MSISKTRTRVEKLEARTDAANLPRWRLIFVMPEDDLDAVKSKNETENGPIHPSEGWLVFRGVSPSI